MRCSGCGENFVLIIEKVHAVNDVNGCSVKVKLKEGMCNRCLRRTLNDFINNVTIDPRADQLINEKR